MDKSGTVQINYQTFALPFCLVSLIFFGIWPVSLFTFLLALLRVRYYNGTLNSFIDFFFQIFPLPAIEVLVLLCLIGSILFISRMKGRSLYWKAGIPLCALCCIFIVSALTYDYPYGRGQHTPVSGIICFVALMFLPLGVNLVIREFRDSLFDEVRSFSQKVGVLGLLISLIPVIIEMEIIPDWMAFKFQMVFSIVFLAGILVAVISLFGLMPVLGIRLFRLGFRLRQTPPDTIESAQS